MVIRREAGEENIKYMLLVVSKLDDEQQYNANIIYWILTKYTS